MGATGTLDMAAAALPNKHEDLDAIARKYAGTIETLLSDYKREADRSATERDEQLLARVEDKIRKQHEQWTEEVKQLDRRYAMPVGAEDGDDGRRKGNKFSISKVAVAVGIKNWDVAPFEKEVITTYHKALSTDVDSLGGFLIPEEHSSQVIDLLRAQVVATELGATEITGGRPMPMLWPKLTGDVAAAWVSENGTIADSNATFGQIALKPRKLASRVKLSTEITAHSAPQADQLVMQSMAKQFALAVDRAAMRGTGNSQPNGIVNLAAASVDFTTGTAPNIYFNLVSMMRAIAVANAESNAGGKYGWALHPDVVYKAMISAGDKASSGSDPQVARTLLTDGAPSNFLGRPYRTTTQLVQPTGTPATGGVSLIYADWTELYIGRWSSLAIRASDTASDAFENDQVHVRGILRCDVQVAHNESFAIGIKFPAF